MIREKLQQIAEAAEKTVSGPLGIGFKDLKTGEEFFFNGDFVFPTASVFKIFVLAEILLKQKKGLLSLHDRHTLRDSEKSIGSGILEMIEDGADLSLHDYVMLMMSISDNTATDYLMKLADPEDIRRDLLLPHGLEHTRCNMDCRGLLTAYYGITVEEYREIVRKDERFHMRNGSYFRCTEEKNDQSSPKDLTKTMSLLYAGRFVDAENDAAILDIMAKCHTNARIPAKLPASVKVAHKTGSIDHLANDTGIVYTAKGDYVLSLFYNGNLASEEEYEGTAWGTKGTALLAQLSRDIYDAYMEA